jgi:hypothetical protein
MLNMRTRGAVPSSLSVSSSKPCVGCPSSSYAERLDHSRCERQVMYNEAHADCTSGRVDTSRGVVRSIINKMKQLSSRLGGIHPVDGIART